MNKVIDYNMKKLLRYVQEFQLLWLEYGKLPLQEFSNNQELLVCLKMLVMLIGQQIRSFPEAIRKEIATTCVIPCGLAENTKTSFEQYRANLHHYGTNNEPYEEVSFVELTKIAKKCINSWLDYKRMWAEIHISLLNRLKSQHCRMTMLNNLRD
ncbi:MAG: hypothetical protein HWD59_09100 [Coxiellaceae bacterium]|nr:MAG: hypothetical protein HWD59_09100 [Coxiellaceae bacterium]